MSALDEDGELVARVEFSTTTAAEQGTCAVSRATVPDPARDPAHGCGPRAAS